MALASRKRDLMRVQFDASDLAQQMRVKSVFDSELAAQSGQGVPTARAPAGRAETIRGGGLRGDWC
jgi:hypothetical protein